MTHFCILAIHNKTSPHFPNRKTKHRGAFATTEDVEPVAHSERKVLCNCFVVVRRWGVLSSTTSFDDDAPWLWLVSPHKMRLSLIALSCLFALAQADVFSTITKEAHDIISGATIKDVKIRQCTCDEQSDCVAELKLQGLDCIDNCWSKLNSITKKPDELRSCFNKADIILDSLIDCFEDNVDSCLADKKDVQIQKVDINKLFTLAVDKLNKTKERLTKTLATPLKKIINTVGEFGLCVKDCFADKNKDGYCFDKKECQPLIVDKKAKSSLKTCTKIIDFKKEAGDLCECSVKAGISDLNQYCPMLKLLGNKRRTGSSKSD
ncbi:hypothetical protein M3Y97_00942700 [Aphelenchoides bicaudatus]|nr:hypothetical protein M3Y97_00942700 [Aphelenchoides bicaudatus]